MYKGKIKTHSRDIAAAVTPEKISAAPGTEQLSSDIVIQAKPSNTESCFIGDSAAQLFELVPGAAISISDMFSLTAELPFDLEDIYCKAAVDGEGIVVLTTEKVSI